MAQMDFVPKAPRDIVIRPLTKGIVRDVAPQELPTGGFWDLSNLIVHRDGLHRRGGFSQVAGGDTIPTLDQPATDLTIHMKDDGTFESILFGKRFVYKVNFSGGFTQQKWTYTPAGTGYFVQDGSGLWWLVDEGEDFTSASPALTPRDVLVVDASPDEYYDVLAINNGSCQVEATGPSSGVTPFESGTAAGGGNNHGTYGDYIQLESGHSAEVNDYVLVESQVRQITAIQDTDYATVSGGDWGTVPQNGDSYSLYDSDPTVTYTIERALKGSIHHPPIAVNYYGIGSSKGYTVLADASERGLLSYDDADGFGLYGETTTTMSNIQCIEFFDDRLWVGGFVEGAVTYPYRIRWTTKSDKTDFPAGQYLDLPYTNSTLVRLLGNGSILVAYFEDAIFVGYPSQIFGQPYHFERLETAKTGLVGSMAVSRWTDGHFFVGDDDIYFLGANLSLQTIGSPVVRATIQNCKNKYAIRISPDPLNERIIFGFPEGAGTQISKVWSFEYKTGAWSYSPISTSLVSATRFTTTVTWDDLSSYTWGTLPSTYPTWASMDPAVGPLQFFTILEGGLYQQNDSYNTDEWSGDPVHATIESGDMDLDMPGHNKVFTRLSMKINEPRQEGLNPVKFNVLLSTDRGKTWKSLPRGIIIDTGEDEGKVDFRVTGSIVRFKLSETSLSTDTYTISEIVMRGRPLGPETRFEGGL